MGDVGGLYGSIWALGIVIHYLFFSNCEEDKFLLDNYFRVDDKHWHDSRSNNRSDQENQWLKNLRKKYKTSFILNFCNSPVIYSLCFCCLNMSKEFKKTRKVY